MTDFFHTPSPTKYTAYAPQLQKYFVESIVITEQKLYIKYEPILQQLSPEQININRFLLWGTVLCSVSTENHLHNNSDYFSINPLKYLQ